MFHKIHIEISNICNLQCSFCPEVVRSKRQMSLELFRSVVEQAAPITEQVALHLMGEPLTHPKLKEMIQICEDAGTPIFLVTNGILLREDKAELLLRPIFRQVNFSLHSFADNFPDKDPTDYLERIFAFTEMAFEKRPDLYINYRIWNLQSTKGTGAHNAATLERIERRFGGGGAATAVDVTQKKNIRLKNRLYLHFDTEFTWPSMDLPVVGETGRCYGLKNHFGILADGTVVPCCLDKEAAIPLGDANVTPLNEILMSDRARKMVDGFRNGVLVEELCKRCDYIERFKKNPAENAVKRSQRDLDPTSPMLNQ